MAIFVFLRKRKKYMDKYLLLIASAFLFSTEFIFTKLYEEKNGSTYKASVNFSFISSVIMLLILLCFSGSKIQFTCFSVIMAGLLAAVSLCQNLLSIKAVAIGSMAIYTLFMMLGGMIIPFIVGGAFLDEEVKIVYVIATLILIVALILPVFDKGERVGEKKKTFFMFLTLCIVLFFLNGANGTIGKLHQINEVEAVDTVSFLSIKYLWKTAMSCILFLSYPKGGENRFRVLIKRNSLLNGLGYAVVHVAATLLQLYCALTVNSCLMYPLVTGGTLIFTPILAKMLFKEKINVFVAMEIIMSVVATILFVF